MKCGGGRRGKWIRELRELHEFDEWITEMREYIREYLRINNLNGIDNRTWHREILWEKILSGMSTCGGPEFTRPRWESLTYAGNQAVGDASYHSQSQGRQWQSGQMRGM